MVQSAQRLTDRLWLVDAGSPAPSGPAALTLLTMTSEPSFCVLR